MKTTIQNPVKMHFSAYVTDINKTVEFYNKFFRMSPTKLRSDYVKYELDSPGLVASFIQNPAKVQHQFGHLGFRVQSEAELMTYRDQMMQNGLELREEMEVSCCYANQDKFWVNDPDGIEWEVYRFKSDSDTLKSTSELTSACCQEEPVKNSETVACCSGDSCGC